MLTVMLIQFDKCRSCLSPHGQMTSIKTTGCSKQKTFHSNSSVCHLKMGDTVTVRMKFVPSKYL